MCEQLQALILLDIVFFCDLQQLTSILNSSIEKRFLCHSVLLKSLVESTLNNIWSITPFQHKENAFFRIIKWPKSFPLVLDFVSTVWFLYFLDFFLLLLNKFLIFQSGVHLSFVHKRFFSHSSFIFILLHFGVKSRNLNNGNFYHFVLGYFLSKNVQFG